MIGLHTIWTCEAMPFESNEFWAITHTASSSSIDHCVLHILSVDLHLRLDTKQDWVVHDVQTCQKVGVAPYRLVQKLDVPCCHVYLLD